MHAEIPRLEGQGALIGSQSLAGTKIGQHCRPIPFAGVAPQLEIGFAQEEGSAGIVGVYLQGATASAQRQIQRGYRAVVLVLEQGAHESIVDWRRQVRDTQEETVRV